MSIGKLELARGAALRKEVAEFLDTVEL